MAGELPPPHLVLVIRVIPRKDKRKPTRVIVNYEALPQETFKSAHFCSMCGQGYCAMKITEDIRAMADDDSRVQL